MLTSVQFRDEDNDLLLSMPVGTPSPSTPFFIRNVEGLGPVKASITTSPYSVLDGTRYQSATVDSRNIVFTVGIKPSSESGYDPSEHREKLYELFPPKSLVNLSFVKSVFTTGDTETVKILGYVEGAEPTIFSADTDVQISVICTLPYFSALSTIQISGKLGEPIDLAPFGSAPTGFVFDITLTKSLSTLTLEVKPGKKLVLKGSLNAGDRYRISTVAANKFVYRTRANITTTELNLISEGTLSLALNKRTKSFYANKGTAEANKQPFTIQATPQFVGL